MAPAWLLAVFVFLCLRSGGDAITCRTCFIRSRREKCDTETCTVEGGFCATLIGRRSLTLAEGIPDTMVEWKCAPRDYKFCGQTRTHVHDPDLWISISCCDKSNFCNSKIPKNRFSLGGLVTWHDAY